MFRTVPGSSRSLTEYIDVQFDFLDFLIRLLISQLEDLSLSSVRLLIRRSA